MSNNVEQTNTQSTENSEQVDTSLKAGSSLLQESPSGETSVIVPEQHSESSKTAEPILESKKEAEEKVNHHEVVENEPLVSNVPVEQEVHTTLVIDPQDVQELVESNQQTQESNETQVSGQSTTEVDNHHHTKATDPITKSDAFEAQQEEEEYEINSRIKQEEDEMTLQMLWPGGNDYKIERIDFLAPSVETQQDRSSSLVFEFHSAYRLTRELIRIGIYNHLGEHLKGTEWICKLLNSPAHPKKHENHLFFYIGDRKNAIKTYIQLLRKARKDFNLRLYFDFPPIGQHANCGMNSQPVRHMNWYLGSERARSDYDLAVEYVTDFWNLINEKRNPPTAVEGSLDSNDASTSPSDPFMMNLSPFSVFSNIPVVRTYAQRLEQYVTRIETLFGLPSQHLPAFMVVQQSNGRDDGELEYAANSMQTKWLQTADVCIAVLDGLLDDDSRVSDEERSEWRSLLAVLLKAVKYHIQLSKWNLSFDTLDAQFRKDIEDFSPVVSTILSYRPPSERVAGGGGAAPAPVERDGSWLLNRLARPFLEVKDIFFNLPGNLRVQPCGSKRLETLEFVLSLLDTQHPLIDQILTRRLTGDSNQNLLGFSLDSIFIWKWNNIVHHKVVKMLKSILERGGEGKAIRKWLFVDFGLLGKIVKEMRSGNGSEGNRGHLIVVANFIESSPVKDEAAALLKDSFEEWRDWVSKDLEQINKKERTILGGLGPQSGF